MITFGANVLIKFPTELYSADSTWDGSGWNNPTLLDKQHLKALVNGAEPRINNTFVSDPPDDPFSIFMSTQDDRKLFGSIFGHLESIINDPSKSPELVKKAKKVLTGLMVNNTDHVVELTPRDMEDMRNLENATDKGGLCTEIFNRHGVDITV